MPLFSPNQKFHFLGLGSPSGLWIWYKMVNKFGRQNREMLLGGGMGISFGYGCYSDGPLKDDVKYYFVISKKIKFKHSEYLYK